MSFIAHAGTRVRYTVGCSGKNGSGRGTRGGGSGGAKYLYLVICKAIF